MKTPTQLLCIFLCIVVSAAADDTIYLKHGGRMTGTIFNISRASVSVNVGFGEMEVDIAEIARIDWGGKAGREDLVRAWEDRARATEQQSAPVAQELQAPAADTKTAVQKPAPKNKQASAPPEPPRTEPVPEIPALSLDIKQYTTFHGVGARPGVFAVGEARVNQALLERSGIPRKKHAAVPPDATIGVYYPKQFVPGHTLPLFCAMGPGIDTGITEINSYVSFADTAGFVVAACELPPESDSEDARRYYLLHIIEYLKSEGLVSDSAVWLGGMSGGAQRALQLAISASQTFSGILAIGSSDDFSVIAEADVTGNPITNTPLCLLYRQSGATRGTDAKRFETILAGLAARGFSRIHHAIFQDTSGIPGRETRDAFAWLLGKKKN